MTVNNMTNHFKIEFDGISSNESFARSVVSAFILGMDPTLEELSDVRTAVSEAVTNSIVHGYRVGKGTVIMECTLVSDLFTVEITDHGCGIENVEEAMQPFFTTDGGEERSGMGFAVMAAFMDTLVVESEPGNGTKVRMQKHILGKDGELSDAGKGAD